MTITLTNENPQNVRRIDGRITATLGNGQSYINWRGGYTNIAPLASFVSSWNQSLPAVGPVVGSNVFQLVARDVTPAPYNLPPYLPSGYMDTDMCTVVGIQPVPAELAFHSYVLDDDGVGASSGNGDGMANPDETIQLTITLENIGVTDAYGLNGTLTSGHASVNVLDGSTSYDTIPAGGTGTNQNDLVFALDLLATDKDYLDFQLHLSNGFQSWNLYFTVPVTAPVVIYQAQLVDDTPLGNSDGDADMGESPYLELTLLNQGDLDVTGVSATLTTLDPALVTFLDDTAAFADITIGNTVTSDSPHFQVHLSPEAPCGEVLAFDISINTDQGRTEDSFVVRLGGINGGFNDDLESGEGNWTYYAGQGNGDWTLRDNAAAHSPVKTWSSTDISSIKDDYLITPELTIAADSQLTFWHRFNMEPGYDGCVIEISTDGGNNWADLGTEISQGTYNDTISYYYDSPIAGRQAWTGNSGTTMSEVVVDLSPYGGSTALIRFRLACDNSIGEEGWFLDDIVVTGSGCQAYAG
jgi:hypothetical protein